MHMIRIGHGVREASEKMQFASSHLPPAYIVAGKTSDFPTKDTYELQV